MRLRMLKEVEGFRMVDNAPVPWPKVGEIFEADDDEAVRLIGAGMAERVKQRPPRRFPYAQWVMTPEDDGYGS